MRLVVCMLVFIATAAVWRCANVRPSVPATEQQNVVPENLFEMQIPRDPKIIKGTLQNGLTYYIRKNSRPENRVELRLVVNAGSILEDDDQQGLAHFCEHMAFNGTKNFRKEQLVNYLESIGMRFGPEINAYTSFDETVYMLELPTDSAEIMEKGFQVLEDWAHQVSYDDDEIEKERGVVIEEWRLGRGAGARMLDRIFPVLFHASKYADRLPIGKKSVLDTFTPDQLKRFYRDWYRPDLMAVVAVGDFDVTRIKDLVREHFDTISAPAQPRERTIFEVPPHAETLITVASDPEATRSSINIYYKSPAKPETTIGDYRQNMVEALYNRMFNARLDELAQEEDPPFIVAYSGTGQYVRTSEFNRLAAMVQNNGISRGLDALLTEAERVRRYGFTETELEREKQTALRYMEKYYAERDKIESAALADEFIRNYLFGEPIPGIEYEYELYRTYIPGITLEEVNALAKTWTGTANCVITAESPEKPGIVIPTEEELSGIIAEVAGKTLDPFVDDVVVAPLMEHIPEPLPVMEEIYHEKLDVTEWKLANGARVVVKPTDFKNDEILFSAISMGGMSLVADEDLVAGETAIGVITEGGLGSFSQIQLQKLLSGKVVTVSPYISTVTEGFKGQVSPNDTETLFQLVYLYFTAPRRDSTVYVSYKSRIRAYYENRSLQPETAWRDTITVTLTQHHPRYRPVSPESLEKMDLNTSLRIFRDRFADAADFLFFFVGNVDIGRLKTLAETYLAHLPAENRNETWRDVFYEFPEGIIQKEVIKGKEEKSQNAIVFTGDFEWNRHNRYTANAMLDVLRIRLRERIREDLGGTYGVQVRSQFSRFPEGRYRITIEFGCNPERVEELTSEIFSQIDTLLHFGTTEDYLAKVKEADLRSYETSLKQNSFWLGNLEFKYFNNEDPLDIITYPEMVKQLTLDDIKAAAESLLGRGNYIRVVLYPESRDRIAEDPLPSVN